MAAFSLWTALCELSPINGTPGNKFRRAARNGGYDLAAHQRAGKDRRRTGNDHVARIAVSGQGVRNKAVIARIAHGRREKTVNNEEASVFIKFIFDRVAAERNLDQNIHLARRMTTYRN